MKTLLRFVPMLAGILACGIVGVIGVVLSMNDESGSSAKIAAFIAVGVGFGVLTLVKNWVNKKTPQDPK